jgi:ATP-dependent Clp protease ATP-binding subunit ClpA
MFERYTEKARRVIFFARYEASQFGSETIETEHLLLGLFREDRDLALRFLGPPVSASEVVPPEVREAEERIQSIVKRMESAIAQQDFKEALSCSDEERRERLNLRGLYEKWNVAEPSTFVSVRLESIRKRIEAATERRPKVSTSVDLPLSHESKRVLAYGAEESERLNHKQIGTDHLLLGLLRDEASLAARILREHGLHVSQLREEIARSSPAEVGRTGFRFGRTGGGVRLGPRPEHLAGMSGWLSALQDAGRVLHLARHEAAQRLSPCIETTDLLLALTREKEFSDRFPGAVESVRKHRQPEPGPQREKVSAFELPFSEDCKLAFTFAAQEAAELGQRTGPGHLLLGILRVESCAAAGILRDCGLTEAGIRAKLTPPPPPSSDPEQGRSYV